jgi:hypothetical protein
MGDHLEGMVVMLELLVKSEMQTYLSYYFVLEFKKKMSTDYFGVHCELSDSGAGFSVVNIVEKNKKKNRILSPRPSLPSFISLSLFALLLFLYILECSFRLLQCTSEN